VRKGFSRRPPGVSHRGQQPPARELYRRHAMGVPAGGCSVASEHEPEPCRVDDRGDGRLPLVPATAELLLAVEQVGGRQQLAGQLPGSGRVQPLGGRLGHPDSRRRAHPLAGLGDAVIAAHPHIAADGTGPGTAARRCPTRVGRRAESRPAERGRGRRGLP
jgi:hypothetical protein